MIRLPTLIDVYDRKERRTNATSDKKWESLVNKTSGTLFEGGRVCGVAVLREKTRPHSDEIESRRPEWIKQREVC